MHTAAASIPCMLPNMRGLLCDLTGIAPMYPPSARARTGVATKGGTAVCGGVGCRYPALGWSYAYIELLQRHQLHTVAMRVAHLAQCKEMVSMNQVRLGTLHALCLVGPAALYP